MGTKRRVLAVPTIVVPGVCGYTPSITTLLSPRLRSSADSPAVGAFASLARSASGSALASASGNPAASREPHASSRCLSSTAGMAPRPSSKLSSPSVTWLIRRPDDGAPAASGASTSISTTSPGCATEEPAGVPVRITSPSSRVRCWERSATNWASGKIMFSAAVVSSWTSSPLRHVRTRNCSGEISRASIREGPSDV